MLKNGLHRVTALHGALTHLIFAQPAPSLIECCIERANIVPAGGAK